MSALSWFVIGALAASVPWLFACSWLLDRLADADRRSQAWQDECRHACDRRPWLETKGADDAR